MNEKPWSRLWHVIKCHVTEDRMMPLESIRSEREAVWLRLGLEA